MSEVKYDAEFQSKVLALFMRDQNFCERIDGLLKPTFFDSESDRYLFSLTQAHHKKYNSPPSTVAVVQTLKEDISNKIVRSETIADIKYAIGQITKADISDREYIVEHVSAFVRRQATIEALEKSAMLIESGDDVSKCLPLMQKAIDIGTTDLTTAYDFSDNIDQRHEIRKARLAGDIQHNSVTTGFKRFDDCLYRKGWGKRELSVYMGPAKGGKSIALLDHSIKAAEHGYNVLFVSLEVSTEIQVDRMDANISGINLDDLQDNCDKVKDRVELWRDRAKGILKIHEYPTGSYRVSDLRRLVKKYQAIGITFDLVVVDYADIMLPEGSSVDEIGQSKQVYQDLRALAQNENLAVLTATQTNREGAKKSGSPSAVIEATDVASDFNKIRIADLVITINASDLEKDAGEARLYFAASRNQKAVTIAVKRKMACMKHIVDIMKIV